MKRFLTIALAASLGLFVYAGSASAAATGTMSITGTAQTAGDYSNGTSANGVVRSLHNLGIFSTVGPSTMDVFTGTVNGTTQICVFCHTPHHANTDARPIWNRDTSNSSNYISYGSTIAGDVTALGSDQTLGLSAGSVSIACLSCHDGVTTFDNLVNAPGNGMGVGSSLGWSFYKDAEAGPGSHPNTVMGRIKLGTDLSDDRPVNISYNPAAASLRATSTVIANIDLSTGLNNTTGNTAYYGWMTQNLWANKGFIDNTATIGDMLRSDRVGNTDLVECSSCHDPHFSNMSYVDYRPNMTGVGSADGVFLRRVGGNTGSGVCRTCHDK